MKRIFLFFILISILIVSASAVDSQMSYNTMTSNATYGITANSSSTSDPRGSTDAYYAFNGVLGLSGWQTKSGDTSGWIWQYNASKYAATGYTIHVYAADYSYSPNTFKLQGSNDKTIWTTLDSQSGVTWTVPSKTYTFSNTNEYVYYNLSISSNNGAASVYIDELYIYGTRIPPPPVASFTTDHTAGVNLTSGQAPLAVQFTDTSTNTPTSWKYGAKNVTGNDTWIPIGTTQNQAFTFPVGNWSVNLTATNAGGSNISVQLTHINVTSGVSAPSVIFTTNVSSGVNPLSLYLNDTSTGSPTAYNTSWGDNSWTNQTSFPATNITHGYSTAASYWINEYATNAYGTANGTPLLITVYGFANSQFSVFNTAGTAPFTTYLYDTSTNTTGGTNSWYWMLGDGNVSTAQNLWYTYNKTGVYSVNHSFSNGLSLDWENKSAYITVGTPVVAPVASFYGGPQIGGVPLTVFFTDVSSGVPISWNWSVGDGVYYETQNPSHTYTSSGFKTVNLTVINSAGSNTTSQTNFVMVY